MTTFPAPITPSAELSAALTKVIEVADKDPLVQLGLHEIRVAATPGNGHAVAHVPYHGRPLMIAAMREIAEAGHPQAAQLEALAAALEESVRARALNGQNP